jgi:hypothetical protein
MDENDAQKRRIQTNNSLKANGLVEVIRKTSTGGDQRTGETFYKYEKLGVYSSKQAALEALVARYLPDLSIQPLQIDG